jgi:hypothetical protein
MKYNIRINYDTGDTFRTETDCEHIIELNCSLETAEENLKRIKEHYLAYEELNGYNSRLKNQKEISNFKKSLSSERWHTGKYWEYGLNLIDDSGDEFEKSTSAWIGYFERLNYGEVVPVEKVLSRFDI